MNTRRLVKKPLVYNGLQPLVTNITNGYVSFKCEAK